MESEYRILKLKTGDELITKIVKRHNGKVSTEFPMIFKTILMADPFTGMQKEITVLKDWIAYSSDKYIKIPETMIVSYNSPVSAACELYEKEKEKKSDGKRKREITNFDNVKDDMKNNLNDFLDKVLGSVDEDVDPEQTLKEIFGQIPPGSIPENYELEFEFTFPSEEISDETTENEKNHPDYGNRWTDWSSDPRTY